MFRRLIKRVHWEVLIGCLSLCPIPAYSLSCTGLNDYFFVSCAAGSCKAEFRVREVHRVGACGRSFVVEEIPEGSIAVLMNQLDRNKTPSEPMNGLFQVSLLHRFYSHLPSSADELALAFKADHYRAPTFQLQKIEGDTNVQKIRQKWQSEADKGLFSTVVHWVLDIGGFLAALALAFKTTALYRRRVLAYFARTESRLNITTLLSLQVVLFIAGAMTMGSMSMLDFVLIIFIVPILIVIWIYEFLIYIVFRFRSSKRPKNES